MPKKIHPFLTVQASDKGDNRFIVLPEKKAVAEGLLVFVFVLDATDAVILRNMPVYLRVPYIVVDSV